MEGVGFSMRYLTRATKKAIEQKARELGLAGCWISDEEYDKIMEGVRVEDVGYNKAHGTKVQEFYEVLYQDVRRFVSDLEVE